MVKLGAKDLRTTKPRLEDLKDMKRSPIYLILDEVIDTYNIGSLFRLADAIGAKKVFLCGNMEYPPSSRVHRAAVGTEEWVPWEKKDSTIETIRELKQKGVKIIAVEQDKRSFSYKDFKPSFPLAIVVGNETTGVKKEVLDEADTIIELPMLGVNKSFNVWGTAAVVAYKVLEALI
ncbi:MAG TPA: TrmH family RNA methyltransferase [Patescibacteria group bacterium]